MKAKHETDWVSRAFCMLGTDRMQAEIDAFCNELEDKCKIFLYLRNEVHHSKT